MPSPKVQRHKTAIRRTEYSRPIRLALETGLIRTDVSILDYGCGHGDDLRRLKRAGFNCSGWDPHFRPDPPPEPADIVSLAFVLNVIEEPQERAEVLRRAWELTEKVLLVGTRPTSEARSEAGTSFRDGILTERGTFQRFFEQTELRSWIEEELSTPAVSVEPGIVFVFRRQTDHHEFISARFRRVSRRPQVRQADRLYEANREAFEALFEFYAERGRAPKPTELDVFEKLLDEVGSVRQAVHVLRRVVGRDELTVLQERARQDLLVYLALDRFGGRPRFGELPEALRWDVRAHFSSYKKACEEADKLLFAAGNPLLIDAECRDSLVGKLTPTALYIHRTALGELTPVLRVYEGCARMILGDVPEANLIKLKRREPKISYLSYPAFDDDPHPALASSYKVNLKSLKATFRDYRDYSNPPILHRKETFVTTDYPGREKFARVSKQEEKRGLLDDGSRIGTRNGWEEILTEAGFELRGHRLVRRRDR